MSTLKEGDKVYCVAKKSMFVFQVGTDRDMVDGKEYLSPIHGSISLIDINDKGQLRHSVYFHSQRVWFPFDECYAYDTSVMAEVVTEWFDYYINKFDLEMTIGANLALHHIV